MYSLCVRVLRDDTCVKLCGVGMGNVGELLWLASVLPISKMYRMPLVCVCVYEQALSLDEYKASAW